MSMTEFKDLSDLFDEDIYDAISPETCVKNRNSYGGTSYSQVEMQLQQAHGIMDLESAVVDDKTNKQVTVKP
jgi:argininosuccinate lyase